MSIRTSLRDYACTAVALLAVLSGRGTALSQQENNIDIWKAAPSDLTLAVTQVPPVLTVTQVAPDRQRANIYGARRDDPR